MKKIIEDNINPSNLLESHLMNDDEVASLIHEMFERKEILDGINHHVMNSIHREERKAWVRRWGKVVVFSFGLPLLAGFVAFTFYLFLTEHHNQPLVVGACLLSAFTSLLLILKLIYSFKLEN